MKNPSLLLPLFVAFTVAFFIFTPFSNVFALDGVAIVNINTPSVSGSAVTVTGNADSGSKFCGVGGVVGIGGPLCSCCQPQQGQGFESSWQACEISDSVSYTITGPATRTGSVSTTNSVSPLGCTFSCQSVENPDA